LPSQLEEAHSATRLAEKSRRRVESGDGFSLQAHTVATIAAWREETEGNLQRSLQFLFRYVLGQTLPLN